MLQTQFLTDNSSLLARPAMCCTHTNFARSVFFYQILSISRVRCLKDTSWKVATDETTDSS